MGTGGVWVVHDFTSGKRSVRGEPNPDLRTYETVTVVRRDRVDDVLGTRTRDERLRVLRALRDRDKLVAPRGRLQQRVRAEDGSHFRACVFPVAHPDYVVHLADRVRRAGW
jgi:hypothetical protein